MSADGGRVPRSAPMNVPHGSLAHPAPPAAPHAFDLRRQHSEPQPQQRGRAHDHPNVAPGGEEEEEEEGEDNQTRPTRMFHSLSLDGTSTSTDPAAGVAHSAPFSLMAKSPPTTTRHSKPRHQVSLTMDPSSPKTSEFDLDERRRTLSDAAQRLRHRRQSDMQRELLQASSDGAQKHRFLPAASGKNAYCGVCAKSIWTISRQGLRCDECGYAVHKNCQLLSPACLGKQGSIASMEDVSQVDMPKQMSMRLMRLTISSAESLVRRNMFRAPDPFCVVVVDGERFQTSVARKTYSPEWSTQRDMYLTPTSTVSIFVFDAKKFVQGEWVGFLGMAVVPASVIFDSNSLGEGATKVLSFRLKKRQPDDVVTGTICIKVLVLADQVNPETPRSPALLSPSSPLSASASASASASVFGSMPPSQPRAMSPLAASASHLSATMSTSPSTGMLATSPGVGWQTPGADALPPSPYKSLLPPIPTIPSVKLSSKDASAVEVSWEGGEYKGYMGKETGINFTLAVIVGGDDRPQDIYIGPQLSHSAVGFRAGQSVSFVVKAANFYGCSEYSEASELVEIPSSPQSSPAAAPRAGGRARSGTASGGAGENRRHCPLYMAGFCFRGSSCPMYHGEGLQTPDDVAAALVAAAYLVDPDLQMAAAIQASLVDVHRSDYDARLLPQYKRDFHTKEEKFRSQVFTLRGECSFTVQRADLFKTSFFEVQKRKPAELKKRLAIQFLGEGGLDYGGLAREWFYLLSVEIFDPALGMFSYCRQDDYALQVNPNSATDQDHLMYFQFVGRVMGLGVLHRHFLDVSFTLAFYKLLLGLPLTLSDAQDVDPDIYNSMLWVLENDISEVPDMYFTADYDQFGEIKSHELKPGGTKIQVTEENKQEFVKLMTEWRLSRGIDRQMTSLMQGFYEIVPHRHLAMFTERELQFLICGSREYDMDDWKAHTTYQGYSEKSDQVKWLWQFIEALDHAQRGEFLQFCTGTSRVPIEGFQSLQGSDGPRKFCVQRIDDISRLPSAHTCFNRLDLPPYATKEIMREKLFLVMRGSQGFTGD